MAYVAFVPGTHTPTAATFSACTAVNRFAAFVAEIDVTIPSGSCW